MCKRRSRKWVAVVGVCAFLGLAALAACLIQRSDSNPYPAGLPAVSTENWQGAAQRSTASAISPAWVTPNPSFSFAATAAADNADGTVKLLPDQDPSYALGDLTRMQELLVSVQGSGSTDLLAGYLLENNPFNTSAASSASQLSGFGSDFMSDLAQFGDASFGGDSFTSGHHGHKFVVPSAVIRLAKGTGDESGLYDNTGVIDLAMSPTVAFDTQTPPAAPLPSTAWGGMSLLAGIAAWQLCRRRRPQQMQSAE